MNEVLNTIRDRRSIRAYTNEPVSKEQIEILKKVAVQSPSARNLQPYHFAFVSDPDVLSEFSKDAQAVLSRRENAGERIKDPSYDVRYAAPLVVCGHSKGGNLALYAALNASEADRSRIARVVSFDGVGLPENVLRAFEESPAHAPVLSRVHVILPEASIVGVIFPQPGVIRTVDCRYVSLLQHYPYHFVIEGADFVDSSRTLFSRAAAIAIDSFLAQLSLAERERFITLIYDIVHATQAQTLQDILRGWIKNTFPVAKAALETLDRENTKLYLKVITSFYRALAQTSGVLLSGEYAENKGDDLL